MDTNGGGKRRDVRRGGRFDRWLLMGLACLPAAGWTVTAPTPTVADEPLAVASSYGAGVHAYFDGDYQTAYDALTAAIEAGTLDPRAYYYRGLASIKLGRLDDEIDADFAEGASRETLGRGGLSVSRSLERVQGRDRQRLEKYRQRARVAAVQRDEEAIRQRYIGVQEAAPDVLRRRVPEALSLPAEPVTAPAAKPKAPAARPAPADRVRPGSPARRPAETPAEDDPFSMPDDSDDPFGDEPLRDDRLDQRDQQMEETAAELDDRIDQMDQQGEERASELDDRLDQLDAQEEREAAGGF